MPLDSLFATRGSESRQTKPKVPRKPLFPLPRPIVNRKTIFHAGHNPRTHSYSGRPLSATERLHVARQRLRKFEQEQVKKQKRNWRNCNILMSSAASVAIAVPTWVVPAPAPGTRQHYRPRPKDPREPGERRRAIEKRRKQKEARARIRAKEKADLKVKQRVLRMRMRELKNRLRLC
ncbi:hypothetical protein COCMIDRAFT_83746 [Bipolaris oryzae ATCC 44560]|uniref:Uncharacterized protein n=1 Tax=Bipolaris oryzae ATCC 44560 TaxID=930090 RepID=W6ZQQ8_COCMI|nr:uncharacterized protein COCMIDRAFT_83746 [Bipolaris oryzae ATCC 44560]EUC49829.1 hypothetical protein COCMIDRAFT_83746 [Bipolaris oryzae ATCC 44560]